MQCQTCAVSSAHQLDRLISLSESKHRSCLDKNSLKLQTKHCGSSTNENSSALQTAALSSWFLGNMTSQQGLFGGR